MKRFNPYQRLMNQFAEWASSVIYPKRKSMWVYPKENLNKNWDLTDLYERVAAAKQIGYEVVLKATDEGIEVEYVEGRPSKLPYNVRFVYLK